ncbi:hypothetical protein Mal52_55500 [Symmachiella dynata]|uniref:Uncharacterized protein n=1 Tax=Symmachiella dynata TaxID=2527995 RepID=A0A517ZX16_9PLAN|nr:hypothetical protein [Symmachiella dynata]QDU47022.1 hypothetical protein Mal52_55500 [Symmachiella dynata]
MSSKRRTKSTTTPKTEQPRATAEALVERGDPKIFVAIVVWLVIFGAIFFSFKLPNFPVSRADVWQRVPWDLFDLIDPPNPVPAVVSSWGNLSQRVPPLLVATAILLGAWATGQLLLRVVCPDPNRRTSERTFFAFALGLSAWSLITLVLGWFGVLSRELFGGLLALAVLAELGLRIFRRKSAPPNEDADDHWRNYNLWLFIIVPFVLCMLLGALLPSTDFDVLEYHLGGPKEYFQAGRIEMLPHNVYTSFPFGTEMLTLLSMVLLGDWYWGAVAGKVVLMSFGPLTALGIYAAGSRWFSTRAGIYAAAIHLTTPWTYRISTIAYAEGGLTFYLFAALYAVMIGYERFHAAAEVRVPWRPFLLAGLCAGSAMACKYPGVLSVVIPLGIAALALPFTRPGERAEQRGGAIRLGLIFALGTAVTIGPWLIKNTIETGNPVYPLVYSVFGGADWDADLNAKWKHGHSPNTYSPLDLAEKVMDVTVKSDWLSPFLFGLAPLAFLLKSKRRLVIWLWAYVGYLFLTYWIFTHRIDRFWVPLIPVVALLAGVGATWSARLSWRILWIGLFGVVSLYHLTMISGPLSLCGYNAYLIDYPLARQHTEGYYSPGLPKLNRELPPGSKVLCVGNAVVFAAEFPNVYNTVFDYSIFDQWFADKQPGVPAGEWKLRPADEIRRKLHDAGITHIYINWAEILRYRDAGSYGYTDFVTPARFAEMQRMGILGPQWPIKDSSGYGPLDDLSPTQLADVQKWVPSLERSIVMPPENKATAVYQRYQIFPVVKSD